MAKFKEMKIKCNVMISVVISLTYFLYTFNHHQEFDHGRYRIKIKEYNVTTIPPTTCKGTTMENLRYGGKLKIVFFNCKGRMDVECLNKNSVVIEKGSYLNSLDLLKSYYYLIKGGGNVTKLNRVKLAVSEYYQPIRTGIWNFYKSSGKLYKKYIYRRGVLLDSLMIK